MRIASLLPSATEIVCALGLEDSLVAVTHECDYPASVRDKPIVTRSVLPGDSASADIDRHIRELLHQGSGIYRLDADRLTALRPDLILTQELCEVCAVSYPIVERAARLSDAQPHLVSLEPESLADVFDHIRLIGRLTSREVRAEQVVAGLEHRLAAVQHRIAGRPVQRVVLLEWVAPLQLWALDSRADRARGRPRSARVAGSSRPCHRMARRGRSRTRDRGHLGLWFFARTQRIGAPGRRRTARPAGWGGLGGRWQRVLQPTRSAAG